MSDVIKKPTTCVKAKCGSTCSMAWANYWSKDPYTCPGYRYAPALYEMRETFETVGIYVRVKITRLRNENKYEAAQELEHALDVILKHNYEE